MCSFEGIWENRYLEKECSSIAQSVEHAAVNRSVVGSSPTGGAFLKKMRLRGQAVKTSPFHRMCSFEGIWENRYLQKGMFLHSSVGRACGC